MHIYELFGPYQSDSFGYMQEWGYIRENEHPDHPLSILTYTEKAQFENMWNRFTLQCRGLIYDWQTGEIVALPLPKFFNSVQHGVDQDTSVPDNPHLRIENWSKALPDEPFEIFEKLDGSMILVFHYKGEWLTASKGSFTSDQAKWAKQMIDQRTYALQPGITYIAELIHPDNRIVVDYKDRKDLVLLAARRNSDGSELDLSTVANSWRGIGSVVKSYMGPLSASFLKNMENFAAEGRDINGKKISGTEEEGYVVRFLGGTRAKVKLADYLAAHKLFTQTNERTVHEWLATGEDLSGILAIVPDEYAEWVKAVARQLNQAHAELIGKAEESFEEIMAVLPSDHSRKDFALMASKYPWRSALFALHDGAGNKVIEWAWKQLKPTGHIATPFGAVEA